jgi:hypothetical protein
MLEKHRSASTYKNSHSNKRSTKYLLPYKQFDEHLGVHKQHWQNRERAKPGARCWQENHSGSVSGVQAKLGRGMTASSRKLEISGAHNSQQRKQDGWTTPKENQSGRRITGEQIHRRKTNQGTTAHQNRWRAPSEETENGSAAELSLTRTATEGNERGPDRLGTRCVSSAETEAGTSSASRERKTSAAAESRASSKNGSLRGLLRWQ